MVLAGMQSLHAQKPGTFRNGVQEGVVRIKIKPELSERIKETKADAGTVVITGLKALDNLNKSFKASEIKRVFPYSPKFEAKLQKHGLHLWYEVNITTTMDAKSASVDYQNLDFVDIAEPIYEKVIKHGKPVYVSKESITKSGTEPFDDPYLPKQWHYNNTGQTGGTVGADISLYDAWELTAGSSNVIVSIHDEGVDVDHEDLADAMWINEAELNGEEGVDDDGNGYRDDIYGFNFAQNMGMIDAMSHGTHVAGTIGAVNNNGIGVAGVAGGTGNNDGVRIMSCQIMGGVSQGNTPNSFIYAANNGAVISQNSWGWASAGVYEQTVLDAIDYFIEEAGDYEGSPMRGGVVIVASGNNNYYGNYYPAYYEPCIAVSALDAKNAKASYSNYGEWVDISAPGGETRDDNSLPEGQGEAGYSNGILSTFEADAYGYFDGTSMACPHVSGVAALIAAKHGGSGFTPEKLKAHLLTGTDYIDTIAGNAYYIEKLGNGAANAMLALGTDNEINPEAITDLATNGVAQDFVILEWSVPADSDDRKPISFEILYSKEPINLGTMEFTQSVIIDNKEAAGTKVSFEVENLDALTQYYFAVRGIDRWGNISDFSNEVTATTNEGPDAWVDKSDFLFEKIYLGWDPVNGSIYDTIWYTPNNIDASTNIVGSTDFYLHNSGSGVLRWDLEARHIESIDAYNNTHINYPTATPRQSHKAVIKSVVVPTSSVQTFAQEENNEVIEYINPWGGLWVIGETDTSFSNSAATHFVVNSAEGFNLTHAEIYLNYTATQANPAIFEVYFGEDINSAKLTYAQELTSTTPGWNFFNMEEQIFMENGTHFWMVIHIPAGNLYPLGASLEINSDDSKNCYMSLNMGKSWHMFEDLYYNNLLVWSMAAVSWYNTPGEYMVLSPNSGEVVTNDSVNIAATVDATEMINGTYKTSVVINTNELEEPQLRVPVYTEVSGQKAIIKGENIVDCGSVLLGKQKLIDINLSNEGYGKFKFSWPYVEISDPQFTLVGGYLSNINPRSEYTFQILYTPTEAGNATAKVSLVNQSGENFEFNVFGVGAEPPVMEIAPDSASFTNLAIGDTVSGDFYVKNTGNFPLSYYLPAFASGENVGEIEGDFCKYGYSAKTNPGGIYTDPEFAWNDISATGTAVTDYSTERDFFYYPVELSFNFPFFGKMENSVYINNYGLLTFDQNCVFNYSPLSFKQKHGYNPDRFIAAWGVRHSLNIMGNIYYQDLGDRFIVQYDGVNFTSYDPWTWEMKEIPVTYQIILHANGNIQIYYKDLGGINEYDLAYQAFVAIEDQHKKDGLLVTDSPNQNLFITNNTVVEFINPGLGLIYEMTNAEGTVQPGDSVKVEYKAKTDLLNVADHVEKIPVLSNDPFNNPGIYTMNFNVTSGGTPELALNASEFNFGQLFVNDVFTQNLWILNTGKASDTVVSAAFKNGYFTLTGDVPATASPSRKIVYAIDPITTAVGIYKDTLTITTALGEVYAIPLEVEVIEAPQLSENITSIKDTLESGNVTVKTITITNNGGNPLEFAPVGTDWLTVSEVAAKVNTVPDFTYTISKSTDEKGPKYEWTDLIETGTRIDSLDGWGGMLPGGYKFWSEGLKIPFTFNYFGNDYDTLYIGANGVITFAEESEDVGYPFGGVNMPDPTGLNNIIAPLWAFAYPDAMLYPDWGVYYQMFDDKVIVQWHRYTDGFFMGYGISWQAVLYADGHIKFQYNYGGNNDTFLDGFGVIGLENADGTDAALAAYNTYGYLSDEMAISFNPVRKYTVPAGESKDFEITLNAKELYAGDYAHDIVLINNMPGTGEYTIPVELNVTGASNITSPESIELGQVMAYQFENNWGSKEWTKYQQEFEIVNDGTAKTEIFSFDMSKLNNVTVEAYTLGADFLGNIMWMWSDITYLPAWDYSDWMNPVKIPLYIEPNTSMKFRVTVQPDTSNLDAIRDTLVINTDFAAMPAMQITFAADPVAPPVIDINDVVEVYAETADHTESRTFYLSNENGGAELTYEMDIVYIRGEEGSTTHNNAKSTNAVAPVLESKTFEGKAKRNRNSAKFNRTLEHETATSPETLLGYGGAMSFLTGTKFTAPADGFNLTHVQTWYTPGDWLESKIIVEIWGGASELHNASMIYTEEFYHNIEAADGNGSYLTFELTDNHIFYPNEDFYVVFKYPTGAMYPQGVASVNEAIEDRFYYGNGEAWFDIADTDYSYYGWMMKAIENEYASNVWVELTSGLTGSVVAGDSVAVNLDFTAAYANNGINKAEVVFISNDPIKPNYSMPVVLHKNEGPRFNLGKEIAMSVNENETLTLDVVAFDREENAFTIEMAQAYDNVEATFADGVLSFAYTPDYESAGIHEFTVIAEDEFSNSSSFTIWVEVININRAPEVIDAITQKAIQADGYESIDLTTVIADPDGDVLTFTVGSSDESVIKVYMAEDAMVYSHQGAGTSTITITGTDAEGLSATHTFDVVAVPVSVDEVNANSVVLYPNPARDIITLMEVENSVIEIYDVKGALVKTVEAKDNQVSIKVNNLENGSYIVKVVNNKAAVTKNLIIAK